MASERPPSPSPSRSLSLSRRPSRRSKRGRGRPVAISARRIAGDVGAVVVIVAATMAAILVVASIVINLGGARTAHERDQDSADAIAMAGAAKIDPTGGSNQAACTAAWAYAQSNLGVAATPAPTCSSFAGTCDSDTTRTASVTSGNFTMTFTNPVRDNSSLFSGQPATSSDGTACNRFGGTITHTWNFPFSQANTTISVSAVARFAKGPGSVDAPLIILDPHSCGVLTATGNANISAQTSAGLPGYIAVDSDGASCPSGNKVIVDATGNAQVSAGQISMWALSTGNSARAYDPSDVGPGKAFNPAPVASSAPVGRSTMDWRYNCSAANSCPYSTPPYISNLVAADGSGTPAGFTRWSSVYSCSLSSDLVVPKGNWYIDCPSGLSSSGVLTFRG